MYSYKSLVVGAATLLLWAGTASAGHLGFQTVSGNDCAGVYGKSFGECSFENSPVIAKLDFTDGAKELANGTRLSVAKTSVNPFFSSVSGSEFSVFRYIADGVDGYRFTYAANDATDPLVKAFAVKGSNQFNIYDGYDGMENVYEAIFVTPLKNNKYAGLSHVSFYGMDAPTPPTPDVPSAVPLPAAGLLLLAGLGGLGMLRRRK